MQTKRIAPLTLAVLAAVYAAPGARAAEREATLSTVVVTAKGYAAADSETPISLELIERDNARMQGAANLGEAMRGLNPDWRWPATAPRARTR
jgi:hemoglobin/transferrin/lactoferrin receptor protein